MLLSICVPTFNRSNSLNNCLNSISIAAEFAQDLNFEICISDNGSPEQQKKKSIINKYEDLNINFHQFSKNQGFAINALKIVSMAKGEFVWMIGDDDLVTPYALKNLKELILNNYDVEYFFINSYHLNSNYLKKFDFPFNTKNLPLNMKKISNFKKNIKTNFWNIIDPKVSWEFLISMYLGVFKRKKWQQHINILNYENLKDTRVWSNIDNTLIHPMIMCSAFKNSRCFIYANPPIHINTSGVREWNSLYKFVEIVRIPELLDFYRKQGMPLLKYLWCKNFALRNFFNYMASILIDKKNSGREYINFYKHIIINLLFPNAYFSIIRYILRLLKFQKKKKVFDE